jgi:hypothetical protein
VIEGYAEMRSWLRQNTSPRDSADIARDPRQNDSKKREWCRSFALLRPWRALLSYGLHVRPLDARSWRNL